MSGTIHRLEDRRKAPKPIQEPDFSSMLYEDELEYWKRETFRLMEKNKELTAVVDAYVEKEKRSEEISLANLEVEKQMYALVLEEFDQRDKEEKRINRNPSDKIASLFCGSKNIK